MIQGKEYTQQNHNINKSNRKNKNEKNIKIGKHKNTVQFIKQFLFVNELR